MAVGTRTTSQVKSFGRCVIKVSQELLSLGMLVTRERGLADGELVNNMVVILNGFRVWLLTNEMKCLHIEFLDAERKIVERWDFPISYDRNTSAEDQSNAKIDEIVAALKDLPPVTPADYRIVLTCSDNWTPVRGWSPTTLADVSHLNSKSVSNRLIDTPFIGAKAFVFSRGGTNGSSLFRSQ